jgi:YD repeat-containing protein
MKMRRRDRTQMFLLTSIFAMFLVVPALAANGSVSYTYDASGRVTTVSYDTGVCVIYTYDPNGNRTSETVTVSGAGATGIWGCFGWGQQKWGS